MRRRPKDSQSKQLSVNVRDSLYAVQDPPKLSEENLKGQDLHLKKEVGESSESDDEDVSDWVNNFLAAHGYTADSEDEKGNDVKVDEEEFPALRLDDEDL